MQRHHLHHHERHDEQRASSPVEISVLGGFRVTVDGTPIPAHNWKRRAAAALVKILALAPDHRLHREQVMDLLWPLHSPTESTPRLHKAAHFARRATGRLDAIVLRDDLVHLFPNAVLTVDAVRFEELARSAVKGNDADIARTALAWYGGELLPTDRYEDWACDRREFLHLRRLDVLRVASDWRELAEIEPLDEGAHVALMRRHIEAGDGAAAIRQYEHLERVLSRELGAAPGETARRAYVDARRLPHLPETPSSPTAARGVPAEVAELAELVKRHSAMLAALVTADSAAAALRTSISHAS